MPLEVQLKVETLIPVEVEGIVPEHLRGKSISEIERLPIFHGNEKLPLAELFRVAGSAEDNQLVFEGQLAGVHWIGAKMSEGSIRVESDAGRHVGSEMTGGHIEVQGNAGDWLGGEMHGGVVRVRGGAGDLVGSAYRGSQRGMTGGTILVDGPVGNEIAHSMRRGLIAVGAAGDFAALNMIAGTLLVFGPIGDRPAAGMRRGTLGLFGPEKPRLLPTFRAGGCLRPLFLQLMFRELNRLEYAVDRALWSADYQMHYGDLTTVGRGEVLSVACASGGR